MRDHDPNRKGNVAELAFAAEAARLGLEVYKPLIEHSRADLLVGLGMRFLRVQCKWAHRHGDIVQVHLASSRRTRDGFHRTRYSADEVDAIGAYCEEISDCFLIPIEVAAGKTAVSLRLAPARNGQRAALNWADEFRLGAVAQLAERRRGTAEVRGSNPLSSTPSDGADETTIDVGAHQFRNHFGYYLEQAAGGAEVRISRRGRSYARLMPPGT
jgi:prevent-host-death family protein